MLTIGHYFIRNLRLTMTSEVRRSGSGQPLSLGLLNALMQRVSGASAFGADAGTQTHRRYDKLEWEGGHRRIHIR